MKKVLLLVFASFLLLKGYTQPFCNTTGNLVIFSNYDGGVLNINVDQNIPNLKIGIVSYEAVSINLTGTFVGNVTSIAYAGYNGNNNHCTTIIPTTTINGAPTAATTNISLYPPVTLPNANGYSSVICAYSCNVSSSQGGCNTVDQVEAYFLSYFSGSLIYSHKVQYGCWSGTQTVSGGGTCCATVVPLSLSSTVVNANCAGTCDGSITPSASGGQPPYTYTLNNGTNFSNLCAGTYILQVTDAASSLIISSLVITNNNSTQAPTGNVSQSFCSGATVADLIANGNNIQWYDAANAGNLLPTSTALISGSTYFASQTQNNCESTSRLAVQANISVTPLPVAASVQKFCENAQLSSLVTTGQNLQYYSDSLGTQLILANIVLSNGQTVYCSQIINNCESDLIPITAEIQQVDETVTVSGITITANQPNAQYRWLNCNSNMQAIVGANSQSFTSVVNGMYAVEVDFSGCLDTSVCTTINSVNVLDINPNAEIQIFPNPANNVLNISANFSFAVEIFDLTGKQVLRTNNKSVIDISNLNTGLYLVKILNEKNEIIKMEKLVKHKF